MQTWYDLGIDVPSGATGEVRVICPWCTPQRRKQREKDLAVNVSEGVYQCHHCGAKGSIGEKRGTPPPKKVYKLPDPIQAAPDSIHEKMYDWFAARGISQPTVDRNHITTTIRWCNECEDKVPVIAFPYFRDGTHVNTTYRCKHKHFSQEKDAERIFYGFDTFPAESREVIICEGQVDKLAFEEAGYRNVLSIPDGAPNANVKEYASKFAYLESAADFFAQMDRIILAADNDANGHAFNAEFGRRVGRERCRVIQWPDYVKDANDALLLVGPPLIAECVETAAPYPIEGIIHPNDVWNDLETLYDQGYDRGLTVGLTKLDQHYRVRPGLLTILSGHSSHGKSLWLDHIMVRLAKRHDWRFAIFSPENFPVHRHISQLVEIYLSKSFDQGFQNRLTRDELEEARPWINEHFAFVAPDEPNIDAIMERARALLLQKGINGLVMDPWNEIEHACPPGKNQTDYISEVLGKIKRFTQVNGIHTWLLAHPTKIVPAKDGSEAVPTLTDISGSINFRNKADYGVVIWRDLSESRAPSQCHIQKIRFRETGKGGLVEFKYDNITRTMVEVTNESR